MPAQTYLSMLCVFKWGIFMFFAGMVGIMTLTVLFFYPETKGLPIEEAPHVFADHWCVAPTILSVNPTNTKNRSLGDAARAAEV